MDDQDWVSRLATAHAAGRPLALLFDYDGTLAAIRPHPDLAAVPPATRRLLAELAALDRVTVGVVSGRALADLKRRVGLPELLYAGSGGMYLDFGRETFTDAAVAEFDGLADTLVVALAAVVGWFQGTWIERKPGCLSVHYRRLTPLKAACFCEEVRDVLAALTGAAPPLRVRETARAFEVSLASAWTKGDAVARMAAAAGPDTFPVYAGDAANDAEAIDWVNAGGGVTIGIGPDAPDGVGVRLDTPDEFAAGLGAAHAALTGRHSAAYADREGFR